jgi:VWFA-related protein
MRSIQISLAEECRAEARRRMNPAPRGAEFSLRGTLVPLALALLAAPTIAAPQSPTPQQPAIRTAAEEVVLDVVVRDKKGKLVRELEPADFEVLDNGTKMPIRSVRLVEGKEAVSKTGNTPLDPLRQIRLVTLVFERLSPEGRRFARQAAQDLLRAAPPQNVFYAVMTIDQRLSVLQQFTADTQLLRKAADRATSGLYTEFPADSERIKQQLQQQLGTTPDGRSISEQAQDKIDSNPRGDPSQALMVQAMLNILQFNQSMETTEAARSSIFSLLAMVRGQAALPGRKTILYFTEGLRIPTNLDTAFQSVISTANRANVSFYGIDARGLLSRGDNTSAMDELRDAARGSQQTATDTGGRAVRPEEVKAADKAEESMKANVQTELRNLAESTGGFLIANTNDLRTPLRKVVEEIESYYEIAYAPQIETYDGRFHKTTVRLLNSDAKVQSRSGYFALPPGETVAALRPFEAPLLKALGTLPLPKDVAFRSSVLRLDHRSGDIRAALVVEVPLKSLTFTEDAAAKTYSGRTSVVALVKNAQGEVVKKFEQDLPLRGPLDKLAAIKEANFVYKEQFSVPAGRYTVEAAVLDAESGKTGARRAVFIAANKPVGVGLSSVSVVRRFEPNAKDLDPADPFQINNGRITPTLNPSIHGGKGSQVSLFFLVYPDASIAAKPEAFVEYLLDGQTVGHGDVVLTAVDAKGRIPVIMSSSAEAMKPGTYEVRVVVKQGESATEERTSVTIE